MKTRFKAAALSVIAALFGMSGVANAQLVVTELMINPNGNDTFSYEWIEVVNVGSTPIDLDGAFHQDVNESGIGSFDDDFTPNISNTLDATTTIGPGEVGVLYDGFWGGSSSLDYNDDAFRSAWNVPTTVSVIGVNFFQSLNNSGDTHGIWANLTDLIADGTLDGEGPGMDNELTYDITSFKNAIGRVTYDAGANGWGPITSGTSIQWNGTGNPADGANWADTVVGVSDASTSNDVLEAGAGVSDLASPGSVRPGTEPAVPGSGGLIISEIMFNTSIAEPDYEWIEVYNNTGAAIDFSATPYILDDGNTSQITIDTGDGDPSNDGNITSGIIPAGEAAVLFNDDALDASDMTTLWGAGINFIGVTQWESLNNSADEAGPNDDPNITNGFNDNIGLWDNVADYNTDWASGDYTANSVDSVEFAQLDVDMDENTLADNWPEVSSGRSLVLNDLDSDNTIGENWGFAGDNDDLLPDFSTFSFGFAGASTAYNGGEIGSPGFFNVAGISAELAGDFNGDGTVDIADYTVWRDNDGSKNEWALNGNGNYDGVIDINDYNLWVANFGNSAGPSTATAVPEPSAALLVLCGVAGLATRRRS